MDLLEPGFLAVWYEKLILYADIHFFLLLFFLKNSKVIVINSIRITFYNV